MKDNDSEATRDIMAWVYEEFGPIAGALFTMTLLFIGMLLFALIFGNPIEKYEKNIVDEIGNYINGCKIIDIDCPKSDDDIKLVKNIITIYIEKEDGITESKEFNLSKGLFNIAKSDDENWHIKIIDNHICIYRPIDIQYTSQ